MSKMKSKAVGLLSGGLDSAISAKLIRDMGFEVHAVNIEMPWGCGKVSRVVKLSEQLGLVFKSIPLGDDYLNVLRKPKHGYGSAFNPCVDCHVYMVKKAAIYMKEIGAQFVFTGEVLGQRPMSQRRQCLDWVAEEGGIPGRLLRPMSAKLLEPTEPEKDGIVERSKLLDIEGRSRQRQFQLAAEMGLEGYGQPGGGCLLTEKHFGDRIKDVLKHGCSDIASTAVLSLGKYFRLSEQVYFLLGRDERENEKLKQFAVDGDVLLQPFVFPGPLALLRGAQDEDTCELVAGVIQYLSKSRDLPPSHVRMWIKGDSTEARGVTCRPVTEALMASLQRHSTRTKPCSESHCLPKY